MDKLKRLEVIIKDIVKEPVEILVKHYLEILFPGITSSEDKLEQKTYEGILYAAVYKVCVDHIKDTQDHILVELEKELQNGAVLPDEIKEAIEATKDLVTNKINGQGGDA
jgi:hypothetical protein